MPVLVEEIFLEFIEVSLEVAQLVESSVLANHLACLVPCGEVSDLRPLIK